MGRGIVNQQLGPDTGANPFRFTVLVLRYTLRIK
jgi:hypothetical protein